MRNKVLYVIIGAVFSGCVGGFVIKENIVGNYYLVAADVDEDLILSYHESTDGDNYGTIISATVFAVGYNKKFIIVKQHPRTFPNPPNKNITNFFILPLSKGFNWRTNNGLIGPLTLEQFNAKRKELNIPDGLKFAIVKDNLK